MRLLLLILTAIVPFLSHADEIIKCRLPDGRTLYQEKSCPNVAISQKEIVIVKQSPAERKAAEAKLKAWGAQQRIERDEHVKAAQADYGKGVAEALNHNALAQQQVYNLQMQTQTMQQRNTQPFYNNGYQPYFYYAPQYYRSPPYPLYGSIHHPHPEHHDKPPYSDRPVYPQGLGQRY
jgi:biopolymer transport protein ExbD